MKALVAGDSGSRTRNLNRLWNMLNTGAFYSEPGGDFYTKRNPDKTKQRALDQLRQMGYKGHAVCTSRGELRESSRQKPQKLRLASAAADAYVCLTVLTS